MGSYKKKLKDFPEKEKALWRIFDQTPFENDVAAERVSDDEVLRQLDYPAYFELLGLPLPENRSGISECVGKRRFDPPVRRWRLEYDKPGSGAVCKRAKESAQPSSQGHTGHSVSRT